MRGPFELVGDFYDYYYNYVRYYIHRRLIFMDYSWEQFYKDTHFSIFRNTDYENVSSLVKQTTLLGVTSGMGIASMNYAIMTQVNKIPSKKTLPFVLGIVLVGGGIGLTYGITVNATARLRDNKNGPGNHAIASMLSVPLVGVYAKKNKLYWGIWTATWVAVLVSILKLSAMGKITGKPSDELPKRVQYRFSPLDWKP